MTERRPKRAREARASAPTVVVTERDLDLFTLVGLARYASTDQVARDLFPSDDRARRRLRQLFDAGFVAVTLASSTAPNLISLTRRGIGALLAARPDLEDRVRLAGPIRLAGVAHHLAVVDARLYAAAFGERNRTPLLVWSNASGSLGRELGLGELQLQPDGIAQFERAGSTFSVAVEVDCGTEPLATVLGRKFERYALAFGLGRLDALWVSVLAGARRREAIALLAAEHGLGAVAHVFDHAFTRQRPAAAVPNPVGSAHGSSPARPRQAAETRTR